MQTVCYKSYFVHKYVRKLQSRNSTCTVQQELFTITLTSATNFFNKFSCKYFAITRISYKNTWHISVEKQHMYCRQIDRYGNRHVLLTVSTNVNASCTSVYMCKTHPNINLTCVCNNGNANTIKLFISLYTIAFNLVVLITHSHISMVANYIIALNTDCWLEFSIPCVLIRVLHNLTADYSRA